MVVCWRRCLHAVLRTSKAAALFCYHTDGSHGCVREDIPGGYAFITLCGSYPASISRTGHDATNTVLPLDDYAASANSSARLMGFLRESACLRHPHRNFTPDLLLRAADDARVRTEWIGALIDGRPVFVSPSQRLLRGRRCLGGNTNRANQEFFSGGAIQQESSGIVVREYPLKVTSGNQACRRSDEMNVSLSACVCRILCPNPAQMQW